MLKEIFTSPTATADSSARNEGFLAVSSCPWDGSPSRGNRIARAARYRRAVPAMENEAISFMIRGVKVLRSSSTPKSNKTPSFEGVLSFGKQLVRTLNPRTRDCDSNLTSRRRIDNSLRWPSSLPTERRTLSFEGVFFFLAKELNPQSTSSDDLHRRTRTYPRVRVRRNSRAAGRPSSRFRCHPLSQNSESPLAQRGAFLWIEKHRERLLRLAAWENVNAQPFSITDER